MLDTKKQLGRYILRKHLGAGGMGEVYVAHDPKIGRDVAIKVLPSDHLADADRLARFEQEAQAAGSLNHPNIVAVYDVDMNDGIPYVVTELLEGETLRSAIGPYALPVRKAMDVAMQIAQGLAAAHERGIIHRDLKPENIFITSDGRVKILDFGLAKLVQPDSPSEETFSDESTKQVSTDPGTVMGTMGYMSPEQLRGLPIDARTDIFSFGAVFYEMLTGKRAFHRASTADTISAVLREDLPELSETNKNVRPGLDRLVQRCLAKNREQRFHSASDLAFALEAAGGTDPSGEIRPVGAPLYAAQRGSNVSGKKLQSWIGWIAAGLLFLTTVVLAALYFGQSEKQPQLMRFALPAPDETTFGDSCAISPDGNQIAFTAVGSSGESTLWIRSVGTMESHEVPGTAGAAFPFWSPDSRSLAFFAQKKLKKVDLNGGSPQILADATSDPRGGSWSRNGTILYAPNVQSPLLSIPASGGTPVEVTSLNAERAETSHRWPLFLPDGNTFLYFGRGNNKPLEGVFAASLNGGEPKLILTSDIMASFAPSPDDSDGTGWLLFVRSGALVAQPFDPKRLTLSGEQETVAGDVAHFSTEVGPTAYAAVSVSNNGNLLYRSGGDQTTKLAWFDRTGKEIAGVTTPGIYREPRLSPDGRKFIYGQGDGTTEDLHIIDITTGDSTRFTFDAGSEVSAAWSPDEGKIAFASNRNGGTLKLYQKPSNGSGSEVLLFSGEGNAVPDDFLADGSALLFDHDAGTATKNDLMLLPLNGEGKPTAYLQTPFSEFHARISPDGRYVAYTSDVSGKLEVYVQTYPIGGGLWPVSIGGGDHPYWSRSGKELYYMAPDRNLMSVQVDGPGGFAPGRPTRLFTTKIPLTSFTGDRNNFLVSPDDQRFLINSLVDERNIKPLTLVLNWQVGMKR